MPARCLATRLFLFTAALVVGVQAAAWPTVALVAHAPGGLDAAPRIVHAAAAPTPVLEARDPGALFGTLREAGSIHTGASGARSGHVLRPRATAGSPAESRIRTLGHVRLLGMEAIRAAGAGLPTFHAGPPPPRS